MGAGPPLLSCHVAETFRGKMKDDKEEEMKTRKKNEDR